MWVKSSRRGIALFLPSQDLVQYFLTFTPAYPHNPRSFSLPLQPTPVRISYLWIPLDLEVHLFFHFSLLKKVTNLPITEGSQDWFLFSKFWPSLFEIKKYKKIKWDWRLFQQGCTVCQVKTQNSHSALVDLVLD